MQLYSHFTLVEREILRINLGEKKSLRTIAQEMGRNVSSISRELARNRNKNGQYNAWRGCVLYMTRRKRCRKKYRLEKDPDLNEWVKESFDKYWSPEIIVGRWKHEHPGAKLSYSTIYAALRKGKIKGHHPKTTLRRHGKRKNTHQSATIHPENLIRERPEEINERSRVGDWEGDTIYGAIGKGLLFTGVDRKTRIAVASLMENRSWENTKEAVIEALKGYPVLSLNLDNGSEFAAFKEIEQALNTKVYFADPHSPWQRPSNENMNDLFRFFFPKGTNFHEVSREYLDYVLTLINNRPRKCLGWLSPLEVYSSCCT